MIWRAGLDFGRICERAMFVGARVEGYGIGVGFWFRFRVGVRSLFSRFGGMEDVSSYYRGGFRG